MSPMSLLAAVPKPRPMPNMTPAEIRLLAEGRLRVRDLSLAVPETIRRTVLAYGKRAS